MKELKFERFLIFMVIGFISIMAALALAGHTSFASKWTHTCVADDTVHSYKYRDTTYTNWYQLEDKQVHLFFTVYGGFRDSALAIRDTEWTNDTVLIKLQSSPDGGYTVLNRTDSILKYSPTSTDYDTIIVSGVHYNTDTLTTGGGHVEAWIRFMIITRDSMEATAPSILGNTYRRDYMIYLKTTP